ncbi:MAG TPA: BON domain-containing protein [Opitutaceae bacterium]|nr:BON domain-containing protein [Opitutaceae bacterium]
MKTYTFAALLIAVVLPASLFASSEADRKIEAAAKSSYNYRSVLQDHITVKSRDCVVTLTGTVQDRDDKALAQDTVENIPGVFRVDNKIVVEHATAEYSDAWIALKIHSTLLVKADVSAADTKVNVKDGAVTLMGTTRNLAQKELTESYVKDIDQVKSVRNDLVVQPQVTGWHTFGETIDDASITSQVKYALLGNRSTNALKTKVETTDGIVTLTGDADSDAEKSLATKLSKGVRGVRSVSNNMTVKT